VKSRLVSSQRYGGEPKLLPQCRDLMEGNVRGGRAQGTMPRVTEQLHFSYPFIISPFALSDIALIFPIITIKHPCGARVEILCSHVYHHHAK
jgi:hypothetical protein